jgi:hypothetical protein
MSATTSLLRLKPAATPAAHRGVLELLHRPDKPAGANPNRLATVVAGGGSMNLGATQNRIGRRYASFRRITAGCESSAGQGPIHRIASDVQSRSESIAERIQRPDHINHVSPGIRTDSSHSDIPCPGRGGHVGSTMSFAIALSVHQGERCRRSRTRRSSWSQDLGQMGSAQFAEAGRASGRYVRLPLRRGGR